MAELAARGRMTPPSTEADRRRNSVFECKFAPIDECILPRGRMSMKWKRVAAACALECAILCPATPLFAQAVQTATLMGTAKDDTGAVLPGVTVNVSSPTQVGGVQTTITDSQGIYRFPA